LPSIACSNPVVVIFSLTFIVSKTINRRAFMIRIETISVGIGLAVLASPAIAGGSVGVPAPAVGIGVGAVALIGLGYRALKSRTHR
jgi:hypothetical protein